MVQNVSSQAKVVYVDNDPMVLAYAKQLLTDDGTTAVVHADLRDPDSVLNHPDLRELIDFSEPTGLLMTAVLHFVADGSDPWGLVRQYVRALAPGSYLAVSRFFEGLELRPPDDKGAPGLAFMGAWCCPGPVRDG